MILTSFTTKPETKLQPQPQPQPQLPTRGSTEDINFKFTFPFLQKDFIGFKEALAFKESRGKYTIVNKFGYLGKYQFGKTTLRRLKIYNSAEFLKKPELQEKAFIALCKINKWNLRKYMKGYVGKKINGIRITESGMLAAAHLAGAGNVKKYLRSLGTFKFKDGFGTTIDSYLKKFGGYDISNIKANRLAQI